MFKRLQIKFVTMIMGVVVVMLGAVFLCIGVVSYQQAAERLSSDMGIAVDMSANAKRDPVAAPEVSAPESSAPEEAQSPQTPAVREEPASSAWSEPPQLGRHPEERLTTPVAVYVLGGGSLSLASRSGALVDEDVLADALDAATQAPFDTLVPCSQGMVLLKRDVRGTTYIALANDSAAQDVHDLVLVFAGVGVGAAVVFFLISILFARWALKPVRQAWDQQREFVANASHELKTPLSIIKANTEILLDEPQAPVQAQRKWLASTQESAEGMEHLLDDMLVLASLDESSAPKRSHDASEEGGTLSWDASHLVERTVLQFESRAFEGDFTLSADVQEGLWVRSDQDAVDRLVQTLMDNACKYVQEGGSVWVKLASDPQGQSVRFSVTNTGAGIPEEQLERIFDRFYRTEESRGTKGGHGLGLSIAKRLSDDLGARLSVSSTEGETCFAFELPRVQGL